jgi:hypothetical protein
VEGAAFVTAESTVFPDAKHYVTIFVLATAPEVRGPVLQCIMLSESFVLTLNAAQ